MKFWKEHAALRVILILAAFIAGMTLVYAGWKTMPGKLSGLGVMLLGLALLLVALYLYNARFVDGKKRRGEK